MDPFTQPWFKQMMGEQIILKQGLIEVHRTLLKRTRCCAWGRGTGFGSAFGSQSFSLSYTLADICCGCIAGSLSRESNHILHHICCQQYFGIRPYALGIVHDVK
jgi:hypothetical protein